MVNFASFYLKKQKRADRFICGGTGRKPVQCTNVVMEHDHIGQTTTANLATHTRTHAVRKTTPEPISAYANDWPHAPRADSSSFRRRASQGRYVGLAPTESSAEPPIAGHRCHRDITTAAPTPQQHSEQKNPSDTPGNRLPKPNRDPTSARRTTFAKLHPRTLHSRTTTSLFAETLEEGDPKTMPQEERDAAAPPSPDPRSEVSLWSRGRGSRRAHPRRCFQGSQRHPRASPSPVSAAARARISPGGARQPTSRHARTSPCRRSPLTAMQTGPPPAAKPSRASNIATTVRAAALEITIT